MIFTNTMRLILKTNRLPLLLIWGIVQSYLLYHNGVNTSGEFLRFLQEANHLIHHEEFTTPIYFMYSIQIGLIYLKLMTHSSFFFIITLQLIVNVIALFYYFSLLEYIYHSEKAALFGSILLVLCTPYQIYNTYLYTESLFFSFSIIYSYYLLRITDVNSKKIGLLFFFIILLCLTRPTGIFFFGATIFYLFIKTKEIGSYRTRILTLIALSLVGILILNAMMKSGQGVNVLLPFQEEHIICDIRTVLSPAKAVEISDSSLFSLLQYIFTHKIQFLRLSYLRTMAFFGIMRSYYSTIHNIFIGGFFYALYASAIYGLYITRKKYQLLKYYALSLIGIFWLAVIFSCDEWHSRFFLTLTPFIIMLALLPFNRRDII